MTERVPDWWPKLRATVTEWEGRPFVWGEADCACFAAACVEATTGVDLMLGRRGLYRSRLQAAARLKWWSAGSVETAVTDALRAINAPEVPPWAAMCGDLGLTADDVLAVRMPAGFIARGPDGTYGVASVRKAWAITWPGVN